MILELTEVSKRFQGTQALTDVTVSFEAGSIHALVGENGAGKSTCLGVIAGRVVPDSGSVMLDGTQLERGSPREARSRGVAAIYQELAIVPTLSACDNVYLGSERGSLLRPINRQTREAGFARLADSLGTRISPRVPAGELSVAQHQLLEIMRALVGQPRVMLFDEPTATLGPRERGNLYDVIRMMRSRGVAITFVSHNLDEVLELSDRVSVFRNGRVVADEPVQAWTKKSLTEAMVGSPMTAPLHRRPSPPTTVRLSVHDLTGPTLSEPLQLSISVGEVVGIAGLVGAGRSSLLQAIAGVHGRVTGQLAVDGREVPWPASPSAARRLGIALLTEDRKRTGLFMEASAQENILVGDLKATRSHGLLSSARGRAEASRVAQAVALSPGRLTTPAVNLSGGNQQKVLLARAMYFAPRVLLADEPTRGVDVGAKAEIVQSLRRLAEHGTAILVVSSEFEDLEQLCDRVLVLWRGRLTAELTGDSIKTDTMVSLAFGQERYAP